MKEQLIGQHVDLGSVSIPAGKDYLKAGELKLLGIAAEERDPSLPDLPTLKEQGIDFVEATNRGIFVPKETPDEIVDAIDKALAEVAKDEEFQKKLADMGTDVNYKNSEEYTKFLEENYESMKKTLEANGLLKK
jgi:tripartite-type tricarboxylate transporter receptor subunit TctC